MKRVRIVVKGVVQGVGYRFFTRDVAYRLHLSGFVRNLPGGAVEVEAEGDEGPVNAFLQELRIGPISSHVTGMDIDPLLPGGDYNGFEIRF